MNGGLMMPNGKALDAVNGGGSTINGSSGGGTGGGGATAGAAGGGEITYPKSKHQLGALLHKYQQLLKASKEAREKHESLVRYLETKEANSLDLKLSLNRIDSIYKDPTETERLAMEKIFKQVGDNFGKFQEQERAFYDSIRVENAENEEGPSLDIGLLEKQIVSLQLLSKDLDIPETLQVELEKTAQTESDVIENDTDSVVHEFLTGTSDKQDFMKRAESLGIKIPTPVGSIDPLHASVGNYYTEQMILSKISNRLKDLKNLPANLGTFRVDSLTKQESTDELKIKALIELMSLRLLAKQKQLKKTLIINQATNAHYDNPDLNKVPLTSQARRSIYIRPKITQLDPSSLASQLEEKQNLEAKRIQHAKHVEKVRLILETSEDITNSKLNRLNKIANISRAIQLFHAVTEKEESKKLEKTAKQRLQALKANDEEAYIKLLDQTKDHRITHLLKQTNTFLDSLAQAVKVQQVEQGAEPPLEKGTDDSIGDDMVAEKEDTVVELREKLDYYQVAHKIKEEVKEQPSVLVGGQLKEYQLKGLQWMVSLYNNKLNGILADEMGLGKTIQSISLITYLIEKKHEDKFLVIVPLSTITNWTLEFEKWAPSVEVVVYKGSPQQRKALQGAVRSGQFQVILTTYEYIIRERPLLSKFNYSHMIIDEGHRMKNANSKLSVTLRTYYKTKNRLILTGTPLQNNLPELWALLNFVLPKIFNSVKSFDEWFNTPFANTGSQEKIELTEEESLLVIRRLHKVLRPFLLRRLKKDVEKDLPDKVEKVLKCNLSGLQYVLYQQMLKHNALFVGVDVGGAKSGIKGLNNKIMQLRKICNHPFVFEEVETVLDSSRLTNDLIWRVSGKFELLDRILPKFKASGHRVLMFFQMTSVMNIMEDFLRWRDMKYLRLDGATKAEDRQDMLKLFNADDSGYFCFLLSTRAGGLGLNLQSADTVIIFDTDWNPHQDLQAQDRAHRIGQKNEVRILRLITNDSVEEVILERAHQKLDIDGKVIQAGKFDNKSTAEEQEAFLKRLLEAEANKDANEENVTLDDDELNEILARSEEEKELFAKIDDERMLFEKVGAKQGGYKNRLIGELELPPVFTEDVSHHFEKDIKELSRMREKKRVKYDDGLTEEQWLMAMDDDEDTVEDAIRRKEERMARRRTRNKLSANGGNTSDDDNGDLADDNMDEEEFQPRKRARRSATPLNNNYSNVEEDDDEDEEEEDETANNNDSPIVSDDVTEKCTAILDKLCALTSDSDGHNLAEAFMSLPSRKLYPDYYQVILDPVSINQAKKNLKQNKFASVDGLIESLQLMCQNAKTYNEEGSWIYKDATAIEGFLANAD